MSREMHGEVWRKAIPQERDRLQSRVLVCVAGALLIAGEVRWLYLFERTTLHHLWGPLLVSLVFGLIVWVLRAASSAAAAVGAWICFIFLTATFGRLFWPTSALPPLLALFLLTFGATKAGRNRNELLGVAEGRKGRLAGQVMANLGVAGLAAICFSGGRWFEVACVAALAEATADTVSSELGQVFGRRTVMLTTLQQVMPGTDGGVSLIGTLAGMVAGGLVVAVATWSLELRLVETAAAFAGGVAGLLFDSLLGATVERRGWIGNDMVNFASTLFAAGAAYALVSLVEAAGTGF